MHVYVRTEGSENASLRYGYEDYLCTYVHHLSDSTHWYNTQVGTNIHLFTYVYVGIYDTQSSLVCKDCCKYRHHTALHTTVPTPAYAIHFLMPISCL